MNMFLKICDDLCNDYSQICRFVGEKQEPEVIPLEKGADSTLIKTALYKVKGKDEWKIEDENGTIEQSEDVVAADKLISLFLKGQEVTLDNKNYTPEELLLKYLGLVLEAAKDRFDEETISSLVITVQNLDNKLMDCLIDCAVKLKIAKNNVHVVSHMEGYMFYVLSQEKELWSNVSGLFDLTDKGLFYYELTQGRGKPPIISVTQQDLKGGFQTSILDTLSGGMIVDEYLFTHSEKLIQKKIMSSIYLTGKGLKNCNKWATRFLKFICNRRRVFFTESIFAKGAVYLAYDYLRQETAYDYTCVCEGRLSFSVSIDVMDRENIKKVPIIKTGTNWYEAKAVQEIVLENRKAIDLYITPYGMRNPIIIPIALDEFPDRPNKTTRVELTITFASEQVMKVKAVDKGFGEMFPATGITVEKTVNL